MMSFESTRDKIARGLHDDLVNLAISHQYPLSKSVCLFAFYDGLGSLGADVEIHDGSETMSVTFGFTDKNPEETYSFSRVFKFSELIRGGKGSVPGSIKALQDSSTKLFQEAKQAMPKTYNGARWDYNFLEMNKLNFTRIKDVIRKEIERRREIVFLNQLFQEPTTYSTNLMWDVLGRYNLEIYERALELHSRNNPRHCHSPLPHELLSRDWGTFTDEEWPSPRCIERFLWGNYLHEIANIKGYESNTKEQKLREDLIKRGSEALVVSDRMKWGEEAFSN